MQRLCSSIASWESISTLWAGWIGKSPHDHFYFGEYNSYGPGASSGERADFSHQITESEAAEYTVENVLKGWKPGL